MTNQSAHTQYFGGRVERPLWESLKRGWFGRCPSCGKGRILHAYLKVRDACPECGLELHHHRADDAPPYFTILIVGHVAVPAVLIYARLAEPPLWQQLTVGITLTILMSLYLLPRIKGALVGLQWSKYMHGFGDEPDTVPSPDRA